MNHSNKFLSATKNPSDLFDYYCKQARKQKDELVDIWEKGKTISLTIEKAATDEHPVADLKSENFNNWRFQLNRRLCVKGFLHKQEVGKQLELYIDNFGEDQTVFVSYIKKDHLPKEDREIILKELKDSLFEDRDINEQISGLLKTKPLTVKINTVLDDHIIVDYKGLYGTMTAPDLFHSKSKEDMDYYRRLQSEDGTMKVYVNSIDSTGNVTFSETRLPELYNNPGYKNWKSAQTKWVNDTKHFQDISIGQTIKCVIWHYSRSGLFVIFENNGGYVQSLIPTTALTEQDINQWAHEHPVNTTKDFRVVKIDEMQKRITLFPVDVTTPKFPQQVELEKKTTDLVNELDIKEGQAVDVEIMSESKEYQDIVYAKCGKYRGVINVIKDMPRCLIHSASKSENGVVKRLFISRLITRNNSNEQSITLPAIAHIVDEGDKKTYNFSVLDACSKCLEQLDEKELSPSYRETEIVLSWLNTTTKERYSILRWHDLYTFFHLDPKEIQELNYEGDWEAGSKLTVWINDIDQDLAFEAEHKDPSIYWNSLKIKVGDYIFTNKIWLSRMGVYRIKYDGCTGTIIPGFILDEEQIEYLFQVVLIDKKKQILVVSDGSLPLISPIDINDTNPWNLHLYMPIYKNLFLAEDEKSRKWAIIQTTTPVFAFLTVIYDNLNIEPFVRLSEEELLHYKYREFSFPCQYINNGGYFKWEGKVIKNTVPKFTENIKAVLDKKGIKKVGWNYFNNQIYDFTFNNNLFIKCKIVENEKNKIKNWVLLHQPSPEVYFTGKILFSNHKIYPLFSFENPNAILCGTNTNIFNVPENFDCRIIMYDENSNSYVVEFANQRGILKWHGKKELRFFPNEIIKALYYGETDSKTQMPILTLFESRMTRLKEKEIYKADFIGKRTDGVIFYIKECNQRIFIPNKKLFATKENFDNDHIQSLNVKYLGSQNFELVNPPVIEKRPQENYHCKVTILSKNRKDYDAYITGGEFDGLLGTIPAKYVDYKSSMYTTEQRISQGDIIDVVVAKNEKSDDIIFNAQNQISYSVQFKKGLKMNGVVISEGKTRYLISFDNIYGYCEKSCKLFVGRSYDFQILKYVLKNDGPLLNINGLNINYKILLYMKPITITAKKQQLLAHIVDSDNENVYLEAGIYKFYVKLTDEKVILTFMNRFGKIEIIPSTEVYIIPTDYSIGTINYDAEAKIVKIKY